MTINEMISSYLTIKEQAAALAKQEKQLKALLLESAAGRDFFETESYAVTIKTTSSFRLDTEALYKDFPDIKNDYGKVTTSRSVIIAEKQQTEQRKTA